MAEFKPKHDDEMASDAKASTPHPEKEPRKTQGDKLQHAVDEAAGETGTKKR